MVTTATQTETRAPVPALPPLRIVFFGTPAFAVPSLDALLRAAPHTVVGVVAAYGRILTDTILATPRLGMINVHASLLPRYRGAAPVHRAVIAGDTSTGVTIMRVVKALDAGAMFVKEHRPIGPDETSDEVERALAQIGARLLVAVVDQIARGGAVETPQNDAESTYAHRLTREDGAIDWSWPAARVHNLIRGLHPWPHAFSVVQGKRVILRRSAVEAPQAGRVVLDSPKLGEGGLDPPGTILDADGDRLIVATGEGALRILEIQAEGKRPMAAREFLAGHRLTSGDRFAEIVRLPPSPSNGLGGTRKPDTTDAS